MGLFKHLEGENAVLVENGVYKQTDLYTRDGALFAKAGGGFVRLYADGSTSKAKCRIEALLMDGVLCRDKLGRLCDASVNGAQSLSALQEQLLIGGAK